MPERTKLGRWPILLAIVAAFAGLYLFDVPQRALTLWVARDIDQAQGADAELEALCRANRWFHQGLALGYGVRTFDDQGTEIRPWKDGEYDRVARVILRWSNGREVDRTLASTRALDCVFGE